MNIQHNKQCFKMKEKPKQVYFCKNCLNHYNEHNEGINGKILCECKLDNLCHLLNSDFCKNIKIN